MIPTDLCVFQSLERIVSFQDGEVLVKANYNKSRRGNCGLFISNNRIKINADVNGAYQIKKGILPP